MNTPDERVIDSDAAVAPSYVVVPAVAVLDATVVSTLLRRATSAAVYPVVTIRRTSDTPVALLAVSAPVAVSVSLLPAVPSVYVRVAVSTAVSVGAVNATVTVMDTRKYAVGVTVSEMRNWKDAAPVNPVAGLESTTPQARRRLPSQQHSWPQSHAALTCTVRACCPALCWRRWS